MQNFYEQMRTIHTILAIILCVATMHAQDHSLLRDPQQVQELTDSNIADNGKNKSAVVQPDNSVLSTGKWAKVRTKSSGIKMLTSSALKQMGFNDISKVSVYGFGGTQLPLSNGTERVTDLIKLPVVRNSRGILFYAEGVLTWNYNAAYSRFIGSLHQNSDYTYYYITDSGEPSGSPEEYSTANDIIRNTGVYNTRAHYEENTYNIQKSGREWFGNELSTGKPKTAFDIKLQKRDGESTQMLFAARLLARSSQAVAYTIKVNGAEATSGTISPIGNGKYSDYAKSVIRYFTVDNAANDKCHVEIEMKLNSTSDRGWVDYVDVTAESLLDMKNVNELNFRHKRTYNGNGATRFEISNAPKGTLVWSVGKYADQQQVKTEFSGNKLSFAYDNGLQSDFIAFNPNADFEEPEFVENVTNQNLHNIKESDYLIVTHESFKEEAERLATIHHDLQGLNVVVATCPEIYNEFSGGKTDVSAIRDFTKMIYDRSKGGDHELKYLLLFGNGYYDNRPNSTNKNNLVPVYESLNSIHESQTYVTDDFFGWLDDNEGGSDISARMDIAVGRFPCTTVEEAKILVDKSETYIKGLDHGIWKKRVVVVSDDGDSNEHLTNAEKLASQIEKSMPQLNVKRIYQESYLPSKTATGIFYAGAFNDFTSAINDGSLIIDYVGHAGPTSLTADNLFRQKDIQNWTNKTRLPLLITAACEFGPFDHGLYSSAEESVLYANGGFIGAIVSTRVVFSDSNYRLNQEFYNRLFTLEADGRFCSIGEALRYAKIETGGLVNSLKYILLGDPAIRLYSNSQSVVTEKINGEDIDNTDLSIAALQTNQICGSVINENGEVDESFNGEVIINLYDKKNSIKTNGSKSPVYVFKQYNTLLFNGSTRVHNGRFCADIPMPIDMNLEVGYGLLSYYAVSDDGREADGNDYEVLVGGISKDIPVDTIGPTINAWIDYEEFSDGQTTGSYPTLFAKIEDESGINVSGLGIGHDISVFFDENRSDYIILNNNFAYEEGSHTKGMLIYRLGKLEDGKKKLTLKAWDNMNNSSEVSIDVNVKDNSKITFGKSEIYPNIIHAGDEAILQFSHNDGGTTLDIEVNAYSLAGQCVAKGTVQIIASQMQIERIALAEIVPDIYALPKGMYIVKANVTSSSGRKGHFVCRIMIAVN